jgi:hypothetical protein
MRPVGGAIVARSRQVSPVRQEDDGSHQTDGTHHLEADPSLSRRLLSTYPTTVDDEVRSVLARPEDFIRGPLPLRRDSAARLGLGFTVRDGNYLSARWPGDAHRFASEFATTIG